MNDQTQQFQRTRQRDTPPPAVSPPGSHLGAGLPRPFEGNIQDTRPVETLNTILDSQARLNEAGSARLGRWLDRRHRTPTTVRERAQARELRAERAERRAERHQRHLDILEIIRAYLGVACLLGLFLLIVAMAAVAVAIMSGHFTWMPVRPA